MSDSEVARFYNSFSSDELLQALLESNVSIMDFTPSPAASSVSEPLSPAQSEESDMTNLQGPYLRIVEQPVAKFRFRYRSEMQGAHGSLLGRGETARKKSFPAVQLKNYDGDDAVIRCSLYTATNPPVPHMHQLIGKENNKEILDHEVVVSDRNGYRAEFKGLGIVHVSKKDLKKELVRKKENSLFEQLRGDEQLTAFDNNALWAAVKTKSQELESKAVLEAKNIDPNKVKLCFEAFVKGPRGEVQYLCESIFSDTIQNMKSAETGDLKICRIDKVAGTCNGGDEVCVLVEKVCKKNIQVRFFELNEQGCEVWSDLGQFGELDVHHQYAIVFKTPRYRQTDIQGNVSVKVELVRPKDQARSDPVGFTYKPARRYISAKRTLSCRSFSSSDSCSSVEAPIKRSHPISDDDPLLSGQSFSSLSFPSDQINEVMKEIDTKGHEAILSGFNEFLNSPYFQEYTDSFESDKIIDKQAVAATGEIENLMPSLPPSYEVFGRVDHEMGLNWSSPILENEPLHCLIGGDGDMIVTDGVGKIRTGEKKKSDASELIKHNQDDSSSMAKKAYAKLLKLMKSRHPSRLQDMKNIIRAEDKDFGPLHAAVFHGQLKELSDLLSLIIKSNLLKLINSRSVQNQTPLMVAVEENNLDCLKLLCMARADLNCTDDKDNTAFHIAAKYKHSKCMEILLKGGPVKDSLVKVELDRKNDEGETALHIAARQRDCKSVELLVKAGADLNAKTGTAGQTPLHLAVEAESKEVVEYLLDLETIRPDELNFRKQMAEDLVHPDQKEILSLFMAFRGIEVEDGNHDDDNVGGKEEQDEDEDDSDNSNEDEEEEVGEKGEEVKENYEDDNNFACTSKQDANVVKKQDTKRIEIKSQPDKGDFSLLDNVTITKIAQELDDGKKWKLICEELKVQFLIQTFATLPSPTRCLIRYLECEKKKKLCEFRAALVNLNVPAAVKALDNALKRGEASSNK